MKAAKSNVTEAELQAAIHKFLDAGGMIKKLPEQKTGDSRMIGRRWNTSELAGDMKS